MSTTVPVDFTKLNLLATQVSVSCQIGGLSKIRFIEETSPHIHLVFETNEAAQLALTTLQTYLQTVHAKITCASESADERGALDAHTCRCQPEDQSWGVVAAAREEMKGTGIYSDQALLARIAAVISQPGQPTYEVPLITQ